MERNAIAATVLVIMILLGYQWYLARFEAPPQEAPRTAAAPSEPQKSAPTPSIQPAAPSSQGRLAAQDLHADGEPGSGGAGRHG